MSDPVEGLRPNPARDLEEAKMQVDDVLDRAKKKRLPPDDAAAYKTHVIQKLNELFP